LPAGRRPVLVDGATAALARVVGAVTVRLAAKQVGLVDLPAQLAIVEILARELDRKSAAARAAEVDAAGAVHFGVGDLALGRDDAEPHSSRRVSAGALHRLE